MFLKYKDQKPWNDMDVALKIMKSFEKHGLNQFSLQESHDGQMNLLLNEGLLITSIGDEDTYLEVLERIISETEAAISRR